MAMNKKALITGITGQDGSYLADLLLSKGYEVHGIVRRSSSMNTSRIDHVFQDPHVKDRSLFLHYGDITDASNINSLVSKIMPDEVYHLAAQSHVKISFEVPDYTANVDGIGTLRLLDAIRHIKPDAKFYNASTSELYGKVQEIPQDENTPFYPRSPYAAAKLYAYWVTINYREAYNLFACSGILFNHESERRGENFVTRKITMAASRIGAGKQEVLYLGNLSAKRDWGYAPEYVEGMWRMLQQNKPDNYVLATGEVHSVEEFCKIAFMYAGVPLEFDGEGLDRVGYDMDGIKRVVVDPTYFRPTEVDLLQGNAFKAMHKLGWKPQVKFDELIEIMMAHDLRLVCGK